MRLVQHRGVPVTTAFPHSCQLSQPIQAVQTALVLGAMRVQCSRAGSKAAAPSCLVWVPPWCMSEPAQKGEACDSPCIDGHNGIQLASLTIIEGTTSRDAYKRGMTDSFGCRSDCPRRLAYNGTGDDVLVYPDQTAFCYEAIFDYADIMCSARKPFVAHHAETVAKNRRGDGNAGAFCSKLTHR